MAIDSALKRKAATGAGRAWLRGTYPGTAGISAPERAATGLAYPVQGFASPGGITLLNYERGVMRGVTHGVGRGMA